MAPAHATVYSQGTCNSFETQRIADLSTAQLEDPVRTGPYMYRTSKALEAGPISPS